MSIFAFLAPSYIIKKIMEQAPLDGFLNAVVPDSDVETQGLAREFYNSVHSGGFRWIGVGEVEDELKGHRLVVYLTETPDEDQQDIEDSFVELNLRLHPYTFLDLYYIPISPEANTLLPELAIEDMAKRYETASHHPNPRLLFEETIIPPVFYQNP